MDASLNAHLKKAKTIIEWVWFAGNTTLKEGQGVCYDWDYEEDSGDSNKDATVFDARRTNRVEVPTILNARYFAGVTARTYSAKTGGQFIQIYKPGSTCNVWSIVSNTIGVGLSTCQAGGTNAGYFGLPGFEGEGTAIPLQTINRGTPGVCMCHLQSGAPSGLQETLDPWSGAEAEAKVFMVGGVSYFSGSADDSGAKTFALADGTITGLKKAFVLLVVLDSDELTITPATAGVKLDGSTANTTIVMETALDFTVLEWGGFVSGSSWNTIAQIGPA